MNLHHQLAGEELLSSSALRTHFRNKGNSDTLRIDSHVDKKVAYSGRGCGGVCVCVGGVCALGCKKIRILTRSPPLPFASVTAPINFLSSLWCATQKSSGWEAEPQWGAQSAPLN